MIEHIPAGQLEKLGNYELRGQELLRGLEHLEACQECRGKMRQPSAEEITERLLADEPASEVNQSEAIETEVGMQSRQ